MVILKHVVKVRYTDYGSELDTVYRTATSVDGGRAVSDGDEYRSYAEADAARYRWLNEHVNSDQPAWLQLDAGDDIERKCDLNPHGLI